MDKHMRCKQGGPYTERQAMGRVGPSRAQSGLWILGPRHASHISHISGQAAILMEQILKSAIWRIAGAVFGAELWGFWVAIGFPQ